MFFGSASAAQPGTFNLSGVASPAIDGLMDAVVQAGSRDQLETAGRALEALVEAGWTVRVATSLPSVAARVDPTQVWFVRRRLTAIAIAL